MSKNLAPLAKEINHRLDQASKWDAKADDHRLAAALRLAEAKKEAKRWKIPFREWCEENIDWGFENARKLATVGEAKDPAAALMDLRDRNALAVRRHRKRVGGVSAEERKKEAQTRKPPETTEPPPDLEPELETPPRREPPPGQPPTSPVEIVGSYIHMLGDQEMDELLRTEADKRGLAVIAKSDLKHVAAAKDEAPLDRARFSFDALSAIKKLHFMAHIAASTGADIRMFGKAIGEVVAEQDKPKARSRKKATDRE